MFVSFHGFFPLLILTDDVTFHIVGRGLHGCRVIPVNMNNLLIVVNVVILNFIS